MNKKEIDTIKQMIIKAKKQAKKHNKWQAVKKEQPKQKSKETEDLFAGLDFSLDDYFKEDGEFMRQFEEMKKDSDKWFDDMDLSLDFDL